MWNLMLILIICLALVGFLYWYLKKLSKQEDQLDYDNPYTVDYMVDEVATDFGDFLKILAPFCPHVTQELWTQMGNAAFVIDAQWPTYDAALLVDEMITIAVQVNGKVRDQITIAADSTDADAEQSALASDKVQKYLAGKTPTKVIYVKGRLVSVVV